MKTRKKILIEEANLFCNWYIKKKLKKNKISFIKQFKKIIKKLSLSLQLKNNVFVILIDNLIQKHMEHQ